MKNIIKKIIRKIYYKIILLKSNYIYLGKYKLLLPPRHELLYCFYTYPLFDKFLPILAKYLSDQKDIIDVGANIGDTAIALLNSTKATIHCFEGSDYFIKVFKKNISLIDPVAAQQVKLYHAMIGTDSYKGVVKKTKGTASLEITPTYSKVNFRRLDEFTFAKKISLLKIDTDGFDFDVLKSATKILARSKPILFWENQISKEFQNNEFKKTYSFLSKKGYSFFYAFDNYGNLMLENINLNNLFDLINYTTNLELRNSTRTLYYFDLLACTKKDHFLVKKSIAQFKKKFNLF